MLLHPARVNDFKLELLDGTELPMDSQADPSATVIAYDQTVTLKMEPLTQGDVIDENAIYWAIQQTEGWCEYNAPRESNGTYHTPNLEITLKEEYQEFAGVHPMIVIGFYAPNGISSPDTISHVCGFEFYKE